MGAHGMWRNANGIGDRPIREIIENAAYELQFPPREFERTCDGFPSLVTENPSPGVPRSNDRSSLYCGRLDIRRLVYAGRRRLICSRPIGTARFGDFLTGRRRRTLSIVIGLRCDHASIRSSRSALD